MNTLTQNIRTAAKLLAVLAILVVANLAATRYNRTWDLTASQIYSLSPKTKETVSNLDQDATLYFFHTDQAPGGSTVDPGRIRRLLSRYEDLGQTLEMKEVDPTKNPNLARAYSIQENNTIVVKVGEQTNKINSFDLFEFGGMRGRRRGSRKFKGESAITTALIKLTETTNRLIFLTRGHGEYDHQPARSRSASKWVSALEQEGYTVETFKPLVQDFPDTRELVIMLDPRENVSPATARRLRGWYRRGGKLVVAASPGSADNVNELLGPTPMNIVSRQVIASRSRRHPLVPLMFSPKLEGHPAVSSLRDQGLTLLAGPSGYLKVQGDTPQKMMTTGSGAYAKPTMGPDEEFKLVFNPETDKRGPFTIAASLENPAGGKLVALASARMLDNQILSQAAGNHSFAVNLVNWLLERQVSLEISAVPLNYNQIQLTSRQATTLQVTTLMIVPLSILIWGGLVWWNRRNR